jgi:hypothetical protein
LFPSACLDLPKFLPTSSWLISLKDTCHHHKSYEEYTEQLDQHGPMLALRIAVVSRPPNLIVTIILITGGANVVKITIVTAVSTWRYTLGRIGTSWPSFFTSPAISLSVNQRSSSASYYNRSVFSKPSVLAFIRDRIWSAVHIVVTWVYSITSAAFYLFVQSIVHSESALVYVYLIARFSVFSEVVVFFTVLAELVWLSKWLTFVDSDTTWTVSIGSGHFVSAQTTLMGVVSVGDTVDAVVFSAI